MRRRLQPLELRLLRRGVNDLSEGRECCSDCARTPLIGEQVHVFADGSVVCALCLPAHGGEPLRSERVRHSEAGHAVKRAVPIAA